MYAQFGKEKRLSSGTLSVWIWSLGNLLMHDTIYFHYVSFNSDDFCTNMYTQIKNDTYGSIIWAYLKPIMRGKILFTPNTELTRQIIKKVGLIQCHQ